MSFFYTKIKTDKYDVDMDIHWGNIILTLVGVILLFMMIDMFMPIYNVWRSGKQGEAELAQAEWNRQIIVRQAQAKKDAAQLEADAEVLRAGGVAQANKIVAEGLGGPEGYLRYLYIHMLQESPDKQVIYIPTEAGLPILEAGKR